MKFHKSMRIHQKELENSEKLYIYIYIYKYICRDKGPKLYIWP